MVHFYKLFLFKPSKILRNFKNIYFGQADKLPYNLSIVFFYVLHLERLDILLLGCCARFSWILILVLLTAG